MKLAYWFVLIFPCLLFSQKKDKNFFQKLIGNEVKSAFAFLPLGTHTTDPDIFDTWFIGGNYKSFGACMFKNSFRDWTFIMGYKRAWDFTKNFSVLYGIGIMYGYKGKLQDVEGIPLRKTFLITGPVNPVVDLELDYKISRHFSIHAVLTPLVIIYGLQYNF